jgi:hypothetical protein
VIDDLGIGFVLDAHLSLLAPIHIRFPCLRLEKRVWLRSYLVQVVDGPAELPSNNEAHSANVLVL